jgi:hypothetical protein
MEVRTRFVFLVVGFAQRPYLFWTRSLGGAARRLGVLGVRRRRRAGRRKEQIRKVSVVVSASLRKQTWAC